MKVFHRDGHLCDEALLLLAAHELPAQAVRHAERHLQPCAACRARLHTLRTIDREAEKFRDTTPLSTAVAARSQLEAALQQATASYGAVGWRTRLTAWTRRAHLLRPAVVLRAACVLLLLVVAASFRQVTRPLQELMSAYEETGPKPNHALTPGSAALLSVAEVCQRTDDDLDPPLPAETQRAVFRAYQLDERSSRAYQVDYLINPQLGGDNSLLNLWPEPYHATVWNATAKDALETRLHGLVCSGQLDLPTAQRELASDWIAAYKKYFHAARPVRTVADASRTAPR